MGLFKGKSTENPMDLYGPRLVFPCNLHFMQKLMGLSNILTMVFFRDSDGTSIPVSESRNRTNLGRASSYLGRKLRKIRSFTKNLGEKSKN